MASRRAQTASDEPQSSEASLRRHAEIAFRYLQATDLDTLSYDAILHRSLSIKSVISTNSSFAQRSQLAASNPELQTIIQIGAGLQGAIFEQVGQALVMKKEKPGNQVLSTNLRHEYTLHQQVASAFDLYNDSTKSGVRVPRLSDILSSSNDALWTGILHKFPEEYRDRGTLVMMERILPLPKVVRRALVAHFYPRQDDLPLETATIDGILNDLPNKHCLARTYLGKLGGTYKRETFTLRNFPLFLNSMECLGLDVKGLATSMGKAYAIMHWGACVDGDDVEFVLGTSTVQGQGDSLDLQHRAVELWLLDFGQCEPVNLADDAEAVYQAFKGAMVTGDNQLFIPHCQKRPELFAAFREGYVEAAKMIVQDKKLGDKFDAVAFMREYEEYAEDFLA